MEKKRLLAGVVTASMLFAMTPISASAEDDTPSAAEDIQVQQAVSQPPEPIAELTETPDTPVQDPAGELPSEPVIQESEQQPEQQLEQEPTNAEVPELDVPAEDAGTADVPADPVTEEAPLEIVTEEPMEETPAETETQEESLIQSLSFEDTEGTRYETADNGTSSYLSIPKDKTVDFGTFSMVTTEQVSFVQTTGVTEDNVMYPSVGGADDATIVLNLKYHPSYPAAVAQIAMERENATTWTGTGLVNGAGVPELTQLTIGQLAQEMNGEQIRVVGGMMQTASGAVNAESVLSIYSDADNVYFVVYESDAAQDLCTITYDCGEAGSFDLVVPSGSYAINAVATDRNGHTFDGWYTDADCTTAADFEEAVTTDVTLYAKYTQEGTTSNSFDTALAAGDATLPISTTQDFESFTAQAYKVNENQRVVLQGDLDLNGETYSAITSFKGDFDGQNHTISNAAFTKVGENAGMFATLGAGQVVANLNLDNITVDESSATYAGTLVGSAGGVESAGSGQVTIQNVHVTNCDVHGRSAGGIAGFIIWTDVKYCSVQSGTVAGTINAGGIVGISYNNVTDCYAKVTPTALLRRGGIVGNNLDNAAYVTNCWCTYSSVVSGSSSSLVQGCLSGVNARTSAAAFANAGFDSDIWNISSGMNTTLNAKNIQYSFE